MPYPDDGLYPSDDLYPGSDGMNLAAAQLELAARGFDYLSDSRKAMMLNEGKNAFEDAWEWPWLQVITSGPAPLVIPDLKYVTLVQRGAEELPGLDVRQLAVGGNSLNQTGTPEAWYLADQVGDAVTMKVWPAGAATLNVIYIRRSPELQSPDDTPLIPARHHSLWIDYAVIEAYHDSDNFTAAQLLRAEVGARTQVLIETYETRNRQHSIPITVRGWSEDD